jgi:hypothetical protein
VFRNVDLSGEFALDGQCYFAMPLDVNGMTVINKGTLYLYSYNHITKY